MLLRRSLQRLFSTSSSSPQQQLPAAVLELLDAAPVEIAKFEGQGRGLVASKDLQHGEVLFTERPFITAPAMSAWDKVCYHCLKVLQQPCSGATRSHGRLFCSGDCLEAAQALYFRVESLAAPQLCALHDFCQQHGERFPLLAARLALTAAQAAMQQQAAPAAAAGKGRDLWRASTGSCSSSASASTVRRSQPLGSRSWFSSASSSSGSSASSTAASAAAAAAAAVERVNTPLSLLCFANVPLPPPAPWQEAHALLLRALESVLASELEAGEAERLQAALQLLGIDWYASVLARLHINSFRVDAVLPIDWGSGGDMLAAAAAALQQGGAGSGSALYLLASLFNHSCEPNVVVSFPGNDARAMFSAAGPIAAKSQLCISYIDADQSVAARREFLTFAYGFRCGCARCAEELADEAGRGA